MATPMINGQEHAPDTADTGMSLPTYPSGAARDESLGVSQQAPPAPVVNAVRLMLITVGILVISILVTIATKSHLRSVIAHRHPEYTSSHLDTLINAAIISALIFGLIFAAAYTWLAFRVRAGRGWARVVTLILAGLGVLSGLGGLASSTRTTISVLLNLVTLGLNVSLIVLLNRGASNDYFRSRPPA
jgi:hypothetical protein